MRKTYWELKHDTMEDKGTRVLTSDDYEMRDGAMPELIARFETKEEGMKALANYKCSYRTIDWTYPKKLTLSEWYFLEEAIYEVDEDGDMDWVDGGDFEVAEMEEQ